MICAPASAGDLKGFGSAGCGDLAYLWNSSGVDAQSELLTAVGQWTFGYMSGRNAERPLQQRKELAALDNDETALFIIEQCTSYPGLFVYQVVDVIFDAAPLMGAGV